MNFDLEDVRKVIESENKKSHDTTITQVKLMLDPISEKIDRHIDDDKQTHKDVDSRLDRAEKDVVKLLAYGAAAMVFVVPAISYGFRTLG